MKTDLPCPPAQDVALPPLPPMGYEVRGTGMGANDVFYTPAAYTAEQMQEYARAALAARQPVGQIPPGFVLTPEKFGIPADVWKGIEFVIGGPGTGEDEPYLDSTAWVGDLVQDDGSKVHGLHLSCDECPEEGSVTLAEFAVPPAQAVDLGQFQEAVEHWRRDLASDYKDGHMDAGGAAMAEADRLLAPIDKVVKP